MNSRSEPIFAAGAPSVVPQGHAGDIECDVAIVGAGVGGATLAWALRDSGARVLVLEQGDFLPLEPENWSASAVHRDGRYKNAAPWLTSNGKAVVPGSYHYVGGSSKLYGATLLRFRETDFGEVELEDGVSPAWPLNYADLEPYYGLAEELYWVHGSEGDPTGPWRSTPFPNPPLPHDPTIAALAEGLSRQGLQPFPLPQAVDWRQSGRCILCNTCDSYPCLLEAKGDADICAMRPALQSARVKLMTKAAVQRVLTTGNGGRVSGLAVNRAGTLLTVRAERFVIAAGAVNSAALLLRSRDGGVANRSGQIGRNYMAHMSSLLIGMRPGRGRRIQYRKTLGINDWYRSGPGIPYPLGNVQSLGKVPGVILKETWSWVPLGLLEWTARRSVDLFAQTEDLPLTDNRIEIDSGGRIQLHWRPTNLNSHAELVRRASRAVQAAGYPFVLRKRLGPAVTSHHQCGTIRMGSDPDTSPVDSLGRSHDVENLWVVDASVFPSSAAVNPALTVAALALRTADLGELV